MWPFRWLKFEYSKFHLLVVKSQRVRRDIDLLLENEFVIVEWITCRRVKRFLVKDKSEKKIRITIKMDDG